METHSSILAWEIPETEEPVGLQSMGSQRVGHDLENTHTHTHTHIFFIYSSVDGCFGIFSDVKRRTIFPIQSSSGLCRK